MKGLKVRISFVALILFCVVFSACAKSKLPVKELMIKRSDGIYVTVQAEMAVEEEERNYGFMNRKKIPDGTGMLFVFEKDQILSFWMKNTPSPLSIAYLDSEGVIKNIYDMKPYSLAPIVSTVSCRYALEVPQGWYSRAGIRVGDKVMVK
ncbi:MAG: DUF192 domain-containing protein [Treponema sp.]|nr:DUF192 domain-containing protein [Treponema sp.]